MTNPVYTIDILDKPDTKNTSDPFLIGYNLSELTTGSSTASSEIPFFPDGFRHSLHHFKDTITKKLFQEESWRRIALQVTFPMILTGIGLVCAGLLLDRVSQLTVFHEIKHMLIVVTPLLGLKRNLEMTLACRLSTHSNLGHLDNRKEKLGICFANICLDQVEAIVAGIIAALIAIGLGAILTDDAFNYDHSLILVSTCCITASLVSFVFGTFICFIVITAKKFNWNPDNFLTVFAGMVGDSMTLALLAGTGYIIYKYYENHSWIPYMSLSILVLLVLPILSTIAYKHEHTKHILKTSWMSIHLAVLLSSGGGLMLEKYEHKHHSITFYIPLIDGIGGCLVSILVSRIATQLFRDCEPGILPGNDSILLSPLKTFFGKDQHVTAARILVILVIPCQSIFPTIVHAVAPDADYNIQFLCLFVLASLIQVLTLLYLARLLTNLLWRLKSDPDHSIPFLTAFGDLFGVTLLVLVFEMLF